MLCHFRSVTWLFADLQGRFDRFAIPLCTNNWNCLCSNPHFKLRTCAVRFRINTHRVTVCIRWARIAVSLCHFFLVSIDGTFRTNIVILVQKCPGITWTWSQKGKCLITPNVSYMYTEIKTRVERLQIGCMSRYIVHVWWSLPITTNSFLGSSYWFLSFVTISILEDTRF